MNAGHKLWQAQRTQRTGLCVGIDPHYQPKGELNAEFYRNYRPYGAEACGRELFYNIGRSLWPQLPLFRVEANAKFLAGVVNYNLHLVNTAWECGIRVFKPQSAFFERFAPFGQIVLWMICEEIHRLSRKSGDACFIIVDAKRGDISTTQDPYYTAYLESEPEDELLLANNYRANAMTVTTWMGEDVLTPGLSYLRGSNGLIVVTRTSNPSGTTLQDLRVLPNKLPLSAKQEAFRWPEVEQGELARLLGTSPTAHELMLYLTTDFCLKHGLKEDGIQPIFSVMGATVRMSKSFRLIRGESAIALVPGLGHQEGNFENIQPLLVREGPLAGHWGILASSRAMDFPWMKKYGGSGDPRNLEVDFRSSLEAFRDKERAAYAEAGVDYPF